MSRNHKSEAEIKSDIIDILDPARVSTDYINMSLDDLRKILEQRTQQVVKITHDSFQEIYDMPSSGNLKTNEVISLKNRVMKQNSIINELRDIIKQKEDELILIKIEYEKLRNTKSFKNEIHEEGSFAAYIASKEAEEEGNSTPVTHSVIQQPIKVKPYMAYTPSKRLFEPTTFGNPPSTLYNGNINEQDAIKMAIQQSEIDAERIIDAPFERSSGTSDPFETMDEDVPEEPIKRSYSHLVNRPVSLTDDMLNELVELLINREFTKVKEKLNQWSPEVARFIRLLTFGDESFKQMLVSKSINIHRCITG